MYSVLLFVVSTVVLSSVNGYLNMATFRMQQKLFRSSVNENFDQKPLSPKENTFKNVFTAGSLISSLVVSTTAIKVSASNFPGNSLIISKSNDRVVVLGSGGKTGNAIEIRIFKRI